MASKAVNAARARRKKRAGDKKVRLESFVDKVAKELEIAIGDRVKIATEMLRAKVVDNISIPVGRDKSGRVTQRSKPGEFPRADTTQLMKTIFGEVIEEPKGTFTGMVGTPLDYGLILEVSPRLDRRYLTRTHEEMHETIMAVLGGPLPK